MNAEKLIESYVTEVAQRLPRRQRDDVAFELHALLHEELAAKAEAAGRPADPEMATELLQGFGHPIHVAARYRPPVTIIDPADGQTFLRATIIGLVVIWGLGLVKALLAVPLANLGWLTALGLWWGGTVIPSMWWPGVLVMGFGLAAWSRRRWPERAVWQPRTREHVQGGRTGLVLAILGILLGLAILLEPRRLLDVVWQGRAAPAAYEALTYNELFRHQQGPWILALLLLNVPLLLTALVQGCWSPALRRLQVVSSLVLCGVLVWATLGGPIFDVEATDRITKFVLVATVLFTLGALGHQWFQRVRPAPRGPRAR
jgi:hypothetical protein